MSDFVYPRHALTTELMMKERAWNAKFVRKHMEEKRAKQAEELAEHELALTAKMQKSAVARDERERLAEETIRSYVSRPCSTRSSATQAGLDLQRRPSAGSLRPSAAGSFALDSK
mmetsp:Transcript_66223/g.173639  ORF Transcript_66223/g.173639 Transcript_66223/m.173639 type:complete len:115 (+) Transcript_66223:87-431(+)